MYDESQMTHSSPRSLGKCNPFLSKVSNLDINMNKESAIIFCQKYFISIHEKCVLKMRERARARERESDESCLGLEIVTLSNPFTKMQ